MADIATLEHELLGAISSAGDEAALETVRVAALGKSGSVSALLKTLGGLSPDACGWTQAARNRRACCSTETWADGSPPA